MERSDGNTPDQVTCTCACVCVCVCVCMRERERERERKVVKVAQEYVRFFGI